MRSTCSCESADHKIRSGEFAAELRADRREGKKEKTHLEGARLFELFQVRLALERRAGREENVFDVLVDVFLPGREPRDVVVVHDVLPLVALGRLRDRRVLADVDRDLFGSDAGLREAVCCEYEKQCE